MGWLAAGTMPNSLYRMPVVYLFLACVFCYSCSFLFVVLCVCVFLLLSLELGRCSSDLFLPSSRSTPVAQSAPRNLLTRWDVSSIPANGIFLTKNKKKNKKKMPNGWRTISSLVHKIRLHGRRGKGMAESFSRQKSRHAPQKEGGLKILCDLPPV